MKRYTEFSFGAANLLIEMPKVMGYHKGTHYILVALMIAVSCSSSQKSNNELHESNFSEEKSPGQLPQHVKVDQRSSVSASDCYNTYRNCFHYGKAGCSKDLYRGTQDHTLFGTNCQKWRSNKPWKHSHHDLPSNYCRNPDGSDGPWCYTTSPYKRFEYCFIDCAADDCFDDNRGCFHYGKAKCSKSYMYNGKRSHTFDGIQCRKWQSTGYKYSYLAKNYCSNPEGEKGPWCYATKSIRDQDWDYCLTDCADKGCYDSTRNCFHYRKAGCKKRYIYNGTRSYTFNGIKCQDWSSTGTRYKPMPKNFCRNPDPHSNANGGPWCYTTKPIMDRNWDYCLTDCAADDCYDSRRKCFHYGKAECMKNYIYNGTRSYTFDGIKCKEWSQAPKHSYLTKNYCRNPNDGKAPWCYATKAIGDNDWDYCLIDCAAEDCFMYNGERQCYSREEKCRNRYVYNGSRNFNLENHRCAKWSSTTCDYKFLPGSYCRNPNKRDSPWCYTEGKEGTWDYCYDEECDIGDCYDSARNCFHYERADCKKEDSYTGTRDHTLDGSKCHQWTRIGEKASYKNFCRNPAGSREGPWCYTNVGYDYCFLGCKSHRCYDSSLDCFHFEKAGCKTTYSYLGQMNHTHTGAKCQLWNQHGSNLPRNYCRYTSHGGFLPGPSCYVNQINKVKEVCFYDCIQRNIDGGTTCGMYYSSAKCRYKAGRCSYTKRGPMYLGYCKKESHRRYHCICKSSFGLV